MQLLPPQESNNKNHDIGARRLSESCVVWMFCAHWTHGVASMARASKKPLPTSFSAQP